MKKLALFFLCCLPAAAVVNGVVINRTTGKPQAGATVGLNKLGTQNGIELVAQAKTDAGGKFSIDQEVQGPYLIRTAFDGVTYNHPLMPGTPTTDLTLEVYDASRQPGAAKVSKHMMLFEPGAGQMVVNETYLYVNNGKTAWNDPGNGTLHFYLPAGANGKVDVKATAPNGALIGAPVSKYSRDDIYKVDFPVKPGETRFDVTYSVPYTIGSPYEGRIATKDENTYLIAPNGVTLKGDHLNDLGTEPRTQAHIFGLTGASDYKIELTGAEVAGPDTAAAAGADQQEARPDIEVIPPRINAEVKPVLAIALGILGLGFALLYRKDTHERSRR
jgi:hypothetical protein